MSKNIIVIGGGVVGLTSAWSLLEAGHHVTLLERHDEVGGGASFANGGQLSYRYVSPLADAGVPLKALAWLTQKDGPLRFRPQADTHQWRWLMAFLRNCNATDNLRTTTSLLQLGELSRVGMQHLRQLMPYREFSWRDAGKMVLYRTPELFDVAARQADAANKLDHANRNSSDRSSGERSAALDKEFNTVTNRASKIVGNLAYRGTARAADADLDEGAYVAVAAEADSGQRAGTDSGGGPRASSDGDPGSHTGLSVATQVDAAVDAAPARHVLTPAAALAQEPALKALAPQLAGAIFTEGEAVADCRAFCQTLEGLLLLHPRFQCIVRGEAKGLVAARGKITGVLTGTGVLEADYFVLAAGMQSRALAASVGINLPLYPLKGYSLTAPLRSKDRPPRVSVTDFERKVLYARIGKKLRVTAMVDLVGNDERLDPRRVASLKRLAREGMPRGADYKNGVAWAGMRPATPDGAPIVSPTNYPNLWLNTGHGPLGFTFACGSAAVLAGLVDEKPAPFALEFLRLAR